MGTFVGAYEPTEWELHGVNDAAQALVLGAAIDLLQSEPELLDLIKNTTYATVRACGTLSSSRKHPHVCASCRCEDCAGCSPEHLSASRRLSSCKEWHAHSIRCAHMMHGSHLNCVLQSGNIPDSTAATDEYYQAVVEVYSSQIAGTPKETPAAKYFWENFFLPELNLYISHPDGLLKGAALGPAVPQAQPAHVGTEAG